MTTFYVHAHRDGVAAGRMLVPVCDAGDHACLLPLFSLLFAAVLDLYTIVRSCGGYSAAFTPSCLSSCNGLEALWIRVSLYILNMNDNVVRRAADGACWFDKLRRSKAFMSGTRLRVYDMVATARRTLCRLLAPLC